MTDHKHYQRRSEHVSDKDSAINYFLQSYQSEQYIKRTFNVTKNPIVLNVFHFQKIRENLRIIYQSNNGRFLGSGIQRFSKDASVA